MNTPVPVVVETVTDIANEIEQSDTNDVTEQDTDSSTEESQPEASQTDVLFADDVNNAVSFIDWG